MFSIDSGKTITKVPLKGSAENVASVSNWPKDLPQCLRRNLFFAGSSTHALGLSVGGAPHFIRGNKPNAMTGGWEDALLYGVVNSGIAPVTYPYVSVHSVSPWLNRRFHARPTPQQTRCTRHRAGLSVRTLCALRSLDCATRSGPARSGYAIGITDTVAPFRN